MKNNKKMGLILIFLIICTLLLFLKINDANNVEKVGVNSNAQINKVAYIPPFYSIKFKEVEKKEVAEIEEVKVEQVAVEKPKAVTTEQKIIEVPQSTGHTYYDIPLSQELQDYTYSVAEMYGIDPLLLFGVMATESTFNPNAVNGQYQGLFQLGSTARNYCTKYLGTTDYFDPKQNILAGTFYLYGISQNGYGTHMILMAYNLGGSDAKTLWNQGIYATNYSNAVVNNMESLN